LCAKAPVKLDPDMHYLRALTLQMADGDPKVGFDAAWVRYHRGQACGSMLLSLQLRIKVSIAAAALAAGPTGDLMFLS
jgi:hypothetical protein